MFSADLVTAADPFDDTSLITALDDGQIVFDMNVPTNKMFEVHFKVAIVDHVTNIIHVQNVCIVHDTQDIVSVKHSFLPPPVLAE